MFDQLGIWIQRQWIEFREFLVLAKTDLPKVQKHFEAENKRLDTRLLKLQLADDAMFGTSVRGNPGSSDIPSIPTEVGGDIAWQRIPESKPEIANLPHDSYIAMNVEPIKTFISPMIRRAFEKNEDSMKRIMVIQEDLLNNIKAIKSMLDTEDSEGAITRLVSLIDGAFEIPNIGINTGGKNVESEPLEDTAVKLEGSDSLVKSLKIPRQLIQKCLIKDIVGNGSLVRTRGWAKIPYMDLEQAMNHFIEGFTEVQ